MKIPSTNAFTGRMIPPIFAIFLAGTGTVMGAISATFVAGPVSGNVFPNFGENRLYDTKSVTVAIDPSMTNWIAWNDLPTADRVSGSYTGCLGPGGFGTDDFLIITVTDPGGTSTPVQFDWNAENGASSGPQNMIFGVAPDTPPVIRSNPGVLIESGAMNFVFTTDGDYTFKFDFYNDHSYNYSHGDIYLLADIIPEPSSAMFTVLGLLMLWRRR